MRFTLALLMYATIGGYADNIANQALRLRNEISPPAASTPSPSPLRSGFTITG